MPRNPRDFQYPQVSWQLKHEVEAYGLLGLFSVFLCVGILVDSVQVVFLVVVHSTHKVSVEVAPLALGELAARCSGSLF